jgi:phenylacetate-CoA ligase
MTALFDYVPRVAADFEFSAPPQIQSTQLALLREHIAYLRAHSPHYAARFAEIGLVPEAVRDVVELAQVPVLTSKRDLEVAGERFRCVAEEAIADVCLTSGTTGKPVALLQTAHDVGRFAYNEEISFRAVGVTAQERVTVAAALDRCFMAGFAYALGLSRIGATVIRAGSSSVAMLAGVIQEYRPTTVVGVPTFLLALAERLRETGVAADGCGVRRLVCIGEPVRRRDLCLSALGERLQQAWQADVYGTYATTELATALADCAHGCGGHLHPDLMVLEILDDAGRPVPAGSPGEVVATPLQVTGMPLFRFRTGDVAQLHAERCACGRYSPRLGPILGRKNEMLKFRGTTVFPPAIFSAIQALPYVQDYYIEVRAGFDLSDQIRVVVGLPDGCDVKAERIADEIRAQVRVKPEVVCQSLAEVRARTLQPDKRKAVRFFDLRQRTGEVPG